MVSPIEKLQTEPPKLFGDGETDDTDAVNWYFDNGIPLPDPPGGKSYRVLIDRLRFVGVELA